MKQAKCHSKQINPFLINWVASSNKRQCREVAGTNVTLGWRCILHNTLIYAPFGRLCVNKSQVKLREAPTYTTNLKRSPGLCTKWHPFPNKALTKISALCRDYGAIWDAKLVCEGFMGWRNKSFPINTPSFNFHRIEEMHQYSLYDSHKAKRDTGMIYHWTMLSNCSHSKLLFIFYSFLCLFLCMLTFQCILYCTVCIIVYWFCEFSCKWTKQLL